MKNILKTLIIIFVVLFDVMKVNAISLDKNNITIDEGKTDSIDVYANVDSTVTNIDFNLIYSTYDIVGNFVVNPTYTDTHTGGIKHGIVLGEHEGGNIKLGTIQISVVDNPSDLKGSVSITNPISTNTNSETKKLASQTINVDVTKKTIDVSEEIDYNLLKSIDSKIVKIDLKNDVFEYEVTVDESVEKLDLTATPINNEYKVTISEQEISKLDNNKIIIKVSNEKIEKEYEIKVKVSKEDIDEDENIEEKIEDEESKPYRYKYKWVLIIFTMVAVMFMGFYLNKLKK